MPLDKTGIYELLEVLYHRPITNITITAQYPLHFFTHYISPTIFAIAIVDITGTYSTLHKHPLLFLKDTSGTEYTYRFNLANMFCDTWFSIIQWDSPCALQYSTSIEMVQFNNRTEKPTKLLCVDIETITQHPSILNSVKSFLENENTVLLDTIDCKTLCPAECTNMEGALQTRFKCNWRMPLTTFANTAQPSLHKPSITDITSEECLLFSEEHALPDSFIAEKNRLDAIILSTSHKDIESGWLAVYLRTMIENLSSTQQYPLTLYIAYNKTTPFSSDLQRSIELCKEHFKAVKVLNLCILPSADVYIPGDFSSNVTPPLGNASGPNTAFFKVMRLLQAHNTVLQLETDCKLVGGWLDACITYVNSPGQFLVAGAMYDGAGVMTGLNLTHLNGVAFYKVGSPLFQQLLNVLERYILREVRFCNRVGTAYDQMMTHCVNAYLCTYTKFYSQHMFFRYIYRMMVNTSLIVNAASDSPAEKKSVEYYVNTYNAVIVHQK